MESSVAFSDALRGAADRMVRDMKFVSIFVIVYGILACITIVGLIFGIPYIFIGLRLKEAAEKFTDYTNSANEQDLLIAFQKQGSSFFITKVLLIISLAILVIYIIVLIFVFSNTY